MDIVVPEVAAAEAGKAPVRRGGRARRDAAAPYAQGERTANYRNTAGRSHMQGASLGDIAAATDDGQRCAILHFNSSASLCIFCPTRTRNQCL